MRAAAAAALSALLVACATEESTGQVDVRAHPETPPRQEIRVHVGPVTGLASVGRMVFSCSQGGVFVRSAAATDGGGPASRATTPQPPGAPADRFLHAPPFRVMDLAAAAAGTLVLCGGEPGVSGSVALLAADGTPGASAVVASDLLYAVALAPGGESGAAACADGRVLLFDVPSLAHVRTLHEHNSPARDVVFAPDGSAVVSCGLDGVLRHTSLGEPARRLVLQDHTAGVECLAFAAGGQLLASGARDGRVRIHDGSGRLIRTHRRLPERVLAVAWGGPDGAFFAGLADGSVHRLANEDEGSVAVRAGDGTPVHSLLVLPEGPLLVGTRGRIEIVPLAPAPEKR